MTWGTESQMEAWHQDASLNGWIMPFAPWWKRLPVVRHVRVVWHSWRLHRHNAIVRQMGMIPTGYDEWTLFGIWHGLERKP